MAKSTRAVAPPAPEPGRVRDVLAVDPAHVRLRRPDVTDRSPAAIAAEIETFVLYEATAVDLVRVLGGITRALAARGGPGPAAWISGTYGAGATTLAKLLALSLDRSVMLADGAPLADALGARLPAAVAAAHGELRASAQFVTACVPAEDNDDPCASVLHAVGRRLGEREAGAARASAPKDVADAITALVREHAPGATLVLVLDDADQRFARGPERLRPLLAHLARRPKIVAMVTASAPPGERDVHLADAFPPELRVHLGPDVALAVARARLTAKTPAGAASLRAMAQGPAGEPGSAIEDAIAAYPIRPDVFTTLARVTSALPRALVCPSAIEVLRGLLADPALAAAPLGALAPLDAAYSFLAGAIEPDVRDAVGELSRTLPEGLALRAARCIALLEPAEGEAPATAELVTACLDDRLDRPLAPEAARAALAELEARGAASCSRVHGYALVTPEAAEWRREREEILVTADEISSLVSEKLRELLAVAAPPEHEGALLRWKATYSDGRRAHDEPLFDRGGDAPAVELDLRHLPLYRRSRAEWLGRSVRGKLPQRIIWVAEGDLEVVRGLGLELARSRRQLKRRSPVLAVPPRGTGRLLEVERSRAEDLDLALRDAVAGTFLEGSFYVRGEGVKAAQLGADFCAALHGAAARWLPLLREAPVEQPASAAPIAPAGSSERAALVEVALPREREVTSAADLRALLVEIEQRIAAPLARGAKVRLI